MSGTNWFCVVTQRLACEDSLHGAEGVAGFLVISMYQHALAVVCCMGPRFPETFACSFTLMAGIGNSNGATIQVRSLLVYKGAEK